MEYMNSDDKAIVLDMILKGQLPKDYEFDYDDEDLGTAYVTLPNGQVFKVTVENA